MGIPSIHSAQQQKTLVCLGQLLLVDGMERSQRRMHMTIRREQEDILVDWIRTLGRRGVPMTLSSLCDFASGALGKPVGENWPSSFVTRHPEIKVVKLTTTLEACRARSLNRANVDKYFDILEEVIAKYAIRPENIWNMDEKGLVLEDSARRRALVDRDQKTLYDINDGAQEMVTTIECFSAAGVAMQPMLIFPGAQINLEWGRENPCNTAIAVSPNGWTDQELGSKWMEKTCKPETRKYLNDPKEYQLLILDGHNSHSPPSSRPRCLARPPEPPLHLPPPTPHLGNTPAITAALPKYRAAHTRLPTIAGTVPHNDSILSTSQPSHPVEPQPTHHRTVPTSVMGPPDAQNLIPGTSAASPAANQCVTRSRAAAAGARA
ncbi:hypothetical protein CCMSSC00406_0007099 [Pleurotus cornucopiae]|uniref:Uncharacterized protein n=1 Tax=Pleurotus cornucopiae TaxID=5321 RepID=A0ACB7J7C8_PLECO|nr:hypothetical protein CCMSSC00406_0007099 [Pleurotus cornucopiae]